MSGLRHIVGALGAIWPFQQRPDKVRAAALVRAVVAASRRQALYAPDRIPDSLEGRFEAAVVQASLALYRLRGEPKARGLAQAFTDQLFRWLDSGLYEAGVGYQAVPKRMRALAARFYGRLNAYGDALQARDQNALAAALARNIQGCEPLGWPFAAQWSASLLEIAARQALAPWADLAEPALWAPDFP